MVPFFVQIKCQLGKSYEVANRLADAEIASEIYSTAGDFDLILCESAKGLEFGPEATPGAWLALMPPLDAEHACTELRPEYLIDLWAPPFVESQVELAVQRAERLNALLQESFHKFKSPFLSR